MTSTMIAGVDLGKTSLSWALIRIADDGTERLEDSGSEPHDGRPFEALERWYRERRIATCAALGATGVYSSDLQAPALALPEDACQEAALSWSGELPDVVNLVSVGGRGYSILARRGTGPNGDPGGGVQFLENEKCSSGTGENMQKIAGRFGLSLAEADALAQGAGDAIPITARCSVFAKSEMTHHANEGRPRGALFRGYFQSVARNAHALLGRVQVDGPVLLIGGCARIESLRAALSEQAGCSVERPPNYLCFEAIGAAALTARQLGRGDGIALPADAGALIRPRRPRITALDPARGHSDRVTRLRTEDTGEDPATTPCVLGLDLGSTGAKAVLSSVRTGAALADVYDRTRGNPVEAAQRLVRTLLDRGPCDIRAVGVTGSGRQAVATVLRAALPEGAPVVVINEIVAHATAAIRCDPDGGSDLSMIEIGGQDAKYARISGGRIVESDMNKACSAGTGSFLEEQAIFYDVHDIEELTRLASQAERPPDLGQMCTVYVAEAASQALEDGYELSDIFAGFQYSIVHNYLNRVMGQRTLAPKIFFQGKPATNPSLAWTLAAVSGRDITVPPNPGAMGAWGIGLCATEQLGAQTLGASSPLEIGRILDAEITGRSQFTCRDKRCSTLCPIDRTVVRIGQQEETTLSGGACPKYEVSTRDQPKLEKGAPDPFEQRDALIAAFDRRSPGREPIAIPVVGALTAHVPWLATLAYELGFDVRLLQPTKRSLAAGELLCNSFDSCGPAKVSHAVCDADVDRLLFPKIVDVYVADGPPGQSCVTEQAMPELVEQALRARGRATEVVRGTLSFADGLRSRSVTRAAAALARRLGADEKQVAAAIERAAVAQEEFERALARLGAQAIEHARKAGAPIVLVCGSLHVIHDRSLNATIPALLRQNGAMAIPVDCYTLAVDTPEMSKIFWGDSNRFLRAATAARADNDVFPLLLASFGCGPASFVEQIFQALLEGYPHTILESDGHGGTAGFVTRIQAFLQSVRQYTREGAEAPRDDVGALSYVEPTKHRGPYLDRSVRYLFMSGTDYLGDVFAAAYRAAGYDAIVAPPLSEETVACGKRDCSGKECLSYQLLWGAFRKALESDESGKPIRIVQISGRMCRAGAFPIKDRISLERLGLDERVSVTALRIAGGPEMSAKVWAGLVAMDILRQLYLYHLVWDAEGEAADELYRSYAEAVIDLLEERAPSASAATIAARSGRQWRRLGGIIDSATRSFAVLEQQARQGDTQRRPTVFLSGDLMTKGNDFANADLCRHLASLGVRIVFEPTCDFLEFLSEVHPDMLFGRGASAASNLVYRLNMIAIRDALYARARPLHPWLPLPDVHRAIQRAEPILDRATRGGATLAVGSVLEHWDTGDYDGVVMAACWGCDNGLIAESLLRHRSDMPTLFFYDDGTPLDERRLRGFVYRLRHSSPEPEAATGKEGAALPRRLRRLAQVATLPNLRAALS